MRTLPTFLLVFALPLVAQTPVRPSATVPVAAPCAASDSSCVAPAVRREFRGVWVASVANIDWPSKPGLPVEEQKAELLALLDKAQAAHLNAVIFQVRPAADALYASKLEPWSEYLTGTQGVAPNPWWDPLEFAVKESHARGMELHAWFNPYRAKHPTSKGPLAKSHIANTSPKLVKKYGTHLWMDPGEPAVRERTVKVVLDVVKRYDVDGVHLDDYFYPYKEKTTRGTTDFLDDRSWAKYKKTKGTLSRDDWRRENVNQLVQELDEQIHKAKPWVKFGISPFGIWRPGNPEQIKGFDAYEQLYADSKLWWSKGWVDYFTPQLYWPIGKAEQAFPVLLRWWGEQNTTGRHLWPGLYTSRVTEATSAGNGLAAANPWVASEIVAQVDSTRANPRSTGTVHFSMKAFLTDKAGVGTALASNEYADLALVPASPWMTKEAPKAPAVHVSKDGMSLVVTATMPAKQTARFYVVQSRTAGAWATRIVNAGDAIVLAPNASGLLPERITVSAIDRVGQATAPVGMVVVP